MKKLTEHQRLFLLEFFKNEDYIGWENIANHLLSNGKCIVAGNKCIWKGGIGNFVKTKEPEGFIDCLEYIFVIGDFLSSEWFKENVNKYINVLSSKKREIEQEYEEMCNL